MENRVFFPQSVIDQWMVDGSVDLQQNELRILAEGRRYRLVDALRILREVSETGDPEHLVGRVKERAVLEELGAEIVETSMLLGDAAFDVEPGWLGVPATPLAEHLASDGRAAARAGRAAEDPKTDEELLARFVAKEL